MKFPYAVKYNGKVYPANTEIPEQVEKKEVTEPKKAVTAPKKKKAAKGDE